MNAMRILSRIAIALYPNRYEEWKKRKAAEREAMQKLLDANNRLRKSGRTIGEINSELQYALRKYERGKYEQASYLAGIC